MPSGTGTSVFQKTHPGRFFDEVIGLLVQVQAADGYVNSFFQDPGSTKGRKRQPAATDPQ